MYLSIIPSVPHDAVTASVSRSGTARAGMIYSLTCTVSKISGLVNSPTATWTTGGVAVSNGNDITVSTTTSDTSSSSTLTFEPLTTSHEGIYMCLGSLNSPALDEPLTTSNPENQRVQSKPIYLNVQSICMLKLFYYISIICTMS